MVAGTHDDPAAGGDDAHAGEEAGIRLVVDLHIGACAAAGRPAQDARRSAVVVAEGPEQPGRVGRPGQVAVGALHRAGKDRTGGEVLDVDAVHLGALLVHRPGVERVVRRMLGGGDLVVGLALPLRFSRLGVFVQQHLLGAAATRAAGVHRVLRAGVVSGVVLPRAVGGGNGAVVLLDAAAHLGDQGGLQRLRAGEHRAGVGVLRLQVLADVGADDLRVAQHLPPVLVLHPRVVVDAHPAELLDAPGLAAGDGRGGEVGHAAPGVAGLRLACERRHGRDAGGGRQEKGTAVQGSLRLTPAALAKLAAPRDGLRRRGTPGPRRSCSSAARSASDRRRRRGPGGRRSGRSAPRCGS